MKRQKLSRRRKGAHRHKDAVLTHELLDFLAYVAHQLRSPLTVMKGYVAMLLDGTLGNISPSQKSAFEKIYSASERMVRLVNNFLDLPRIHAGTLRFMFATESLAEIVRQAVEESRPQADLKKIKLVADIPHEKLLIKADYENLLQAFANLLDNALKYTAMGHISVAVTRGRTGYRVEVADTGAGIAKENLSRIFGKFVRVDDLKAMYLEGRGLGLYIARRIIEGHGGRMRAESEGVGKGSRFIIELPVKN